MSDPELVTDLLLALRNQDIKLETVSVKNPTLDEVFLALTGHESETEEVEEEIEKLKN